MTQLCKWVGSKRAVLDQIFAHIPRAEGALYIPFLGGGSDAMYALEHGWAKGGYVFSDVNEELITAYRAVSGQPHDLLKALRTHEVNHALRNEVPYHKGYYMRIRDTDPTTLNRVERAARFLFLIGTCFNGLYRTNRNGKMNTPFGDRVFTLTDERTAELNRVGALLRGEVDEFGDWAPDLMCQDFAETIATAGPSDVVYCDPPYIPTSPTSSFASYSSKRFDLDEHRRLYRACRGAARRGARVFVSNSDTPTTREIYHCNGDSPNPVHIISAPRRVSAKASGRGTVNELLIEIRA